MRRSLVLIPLALVASIAALAACEGSRTTVRAETPYGAAEVTFERAAAICAPGESWETCIPRCGTSATPATSSSAIAAPPTVAHVGASE